MFDLIRQGGPVMIPILLISVGAIGLIIERALVFARGTSHLQFADGSQRSFVAGEGSRLLGSSVVLHWRSPGRSGAAWLTAADLPRETLRSLAVHLVAGR